MKILIIIDSFKGTLSSQEIGEITKKRLLNLGHEVDVLPISDGGEGLLNTIEKQRKVFEKRTISNNSNFDEIKTRYLIEEKTAYIEMAEVNGLNLILEELRQPAFFSTYGLGVLIKKAISNGTKNVVVGLGGSATNDAGAGMLEALGLKFFDENFLEIKRITPFLFKKIKYIEDDCLLENIKNINIKILSDVKNTLLGKKGATYVYGPQKGIKEEELIIFEENLRYFSELVENKINKKISQIAGTGCAGGVGFACLSYLTDKIYSGIEYLLESYDFENIVKNYDFVITGEGALDTQSLYGKVVSVISEKVVQNNRKLIILTGKNGLKKAEEKVLSANFIYSIVPSVSSLEESLRNPKEVFKNFIDSIEWIQILK